MALKLVLENTINFCVYCVIYLCFYYCEFFSIDLINVTYKITGLGKDVKRISIW